VLQQDQDDSSCRLEYFLTAFVYLNTVVAHAVDTVGHGEGEGVLAALAGIPAKHGGGMGIGIGDKGAAVTQQGKVDVVALPTAIGKEGVMFAGTQVDLLGFGFALGQAATEMFVQPGAAGFFFVVAAGFFFAPGGGRRGWGAPAPWGPPAPANGRFHRFSAWNPPFRHPR